MQWGAVLLLGVAPALAQSPPGNVRSESAIRDVLAGKRTEANAAWWGFNPDDSTAALQAAIDSKARTVIVPFMGNPWVIRPITLRSNQKVLFDPGVVVLAKNGEFRGARDSLFQAEGESDIALIGYGATLRMRKSDYQNPPYQKAEWRMGIALRGCRNVQIEGLHIESTGGDAFYIAGGGGRAWSEDVTIRNCAASDNHRQGISVISAVNLLLENCIFSGTRGTAPEAGIDLEPNVPADRLQNIAIRHCRFENNHGHGILIYLRQLDRSSAPVSIRFENCLARSGSAGMTVGGVVANGPQGVVEFRDCTVEQTGKEGARVYDKSADGVRVRFVRCNWKDTGTSPILLQIRDGKAIRQLGGVDFADCYVYDRVDRPALVVAGSPQAVVRDVRGQITVAGPSGARSQVEPRAVDFDVKLIHVLR